MAIFGNLKLEGTRTDCSWLPRSNRRFTPRSRSWGMRTSPLTPALPRAGRGRERAHEVNRQDAETQSGKCLWCTSRADLNCGRDLCHRPTRAPFHFVRHLPSEIAVRRAARGGCTSDAQMLREKHWFLRGLQANTLPGTPGVSIFQMNWGEVGGRRQQAVICSPRSTTAGQVSQWHSSERATGSRQHAHKLSMRG